MANSNGNGNGWGKATLGSLMGALVAGLSIWLAFARDAVQRPEFRALEIRVLSNAELADVVKKSEVYKQDQEKLTIAISNLTNSVDALRSHMQNELDRLELNREEFRRGLREELIDVLEKRTP